MENRPDPEILLERIKKDEEREKRGKLKIYFGAAPGVGKTYAMLNDAISKSAQGLDVVVGVAESHGRKEIDLLLEKLKVLPKQTVQYRNKGLKEFDLDGALKRQPSLILIDEMAHTNAPSLRHEKRWQDILEIIDSGIDVYTTLNVQHVESLNDVIAQIIGVQIKETVPDSILEIADTIELIDLPQEDLLKRLSEGKIYIPKLIGAATKHFFQKGNLIALRELALRYTAEHVEAQVLLYRLGEKIERIWPTKERVLVCVGPGPEAINLIRAAKRMAISLQAEWIAIYVETPQLVLTEEERKLVLKNLQIADQLGAETHILNGIRIVDEIIHFARERNVTKMLVWKAIRSRWKDFLFNNIPDELVRNSGEIDVYIITGERKKVKEKIMKEEKRTKFAYLNYICAFLSVGIVTAIGALVYPIVTLSNVIMLYLLGVVIISVYGFTGPSIFASLLSVLAYAFFFIPPKYTLEITQAQYLITLGVMLIVAVTISHLTAITRQQAKASHLAARRTATLHALSRQLAHTRGVTKLLSVGIAYIGDVFNSDVIALLPENYHLTEFAKYNTSETLTEKEKSVAHWVYSMRQIAGLGTNTLSFSDALYLPMLASDGAAGVLKIHPKIQGDLFTPEQMHLLESCANQLGLAIEVDQLQDKAKNNRDENK